MPRKPKASQSADPQAASQSTKERIVDAAEMLFAQQGYEGTTTRAIAMKAGTIASLSTGGDASST